jgi:hypothetical protein
MAVKHTQIAELVGIMVRNVGRARYETLLKDMKASQAYKRNQSFTETIDRLERQLKTGKSKPPKTPSVDPRKGPPRGPVRSGGSPRGG